MAVKRISPKLRKELISDPAVVSVSSREVEVGVKTDAYPGFYNYEKSEEAAERIGAKLGWGGYKTGCGSWVFCKDYKPNTGDWNDRSSSHHY